MRHANYGISAAIGRLRRTALALFPLIAFCSDGQSATSVAIGERIDAHAHILNDSPEIIRMLQRLDMRVINLCVVDKYEHGYEQAGPQHAIAEKVFRASQGRVAWVSTFDPQDWESPGFASRVIRELEGTFLKGAVGVKIYKSIGMDLKSSSGAYLMPDNPVFDPIFNFVADMNKTLYAHIAEPIAAWQPLDPKNPDYDYYKNSPAWHMYGHPERPTKEAILAARDRMIERNPRLRVIGCHLGSMEEDVDDIAKRLDKYPNFAVDTSGRVVHLMIQPRDKVRAFMIKYQDRIFYATDLGVLEGDDVRQAVKHWESEYARDYKFFATDEPVKYEGREIRGLALPPDVLKKFYRDNALRWVP